MGILRKVIRTSPLALFSQIHYENSVIIRNLINNSKLQLDCNFVFNPNLRYCSTQVRTKVKETKSSSRTLNKKHVCIVPTLPESLILNSNYVTGIAVGTCYVTWAKISIKDFTVLEWNGKLLPQDFRGDKDESNILRLAYDINRGVPSSDIYVMETFSMKGRDLARRIHDFHLLSMLAVLLNGVDKGPDVIDKVYFQRKFVMNILHDLVVGSERISTRQVIKNILTDSLNQESSLEGDNTNIYSQIQIQNKNLDVYKECDAEVQEDLSLVLLLALTFIDVNILKNPESLTKIQTKVQRHKYLY